ncbi:hypothetical protein VNO77_42231 [Canavalia gladiata]|uniref:Uncharacterized protein n=1 Tax=Canavalia gladiata TaxID=3824 RepID=A0AAN9PSN2_CANGL
MPLSRAPSSMDAGFQGRPEGVSRGGRRSIRRSRVFVSGMTMAELLLGLLVNIEIVCSFLLLLIFLLFAVLSISTHSCNSAPHPFSGAWYCAVLSCAGCAFSDFVMQGRESKGGGESCHLAKLPNGKLLPSILASNRRGPYNLSPCMGISLSAVFASYARRFSSSPRMFGFPDCYSWVCVKQPGGEWLRVTSHMTKGVECISLTPGLGLIFSELQGSRID